MNNVNRTLHEWIFPDKWNRPAVERRFPGVDYKRLLRLNKAPSREVTWSAAEWAELEKSCRVEHRCSVFSLLRGPSRRTMAQLLKASSDAWAFVPVQRSGTRETIVTTDEAARKSLPDSVKEIRVADSRTGDAAWAAKLHQCGIAITLASPRSNPASEYMLRSLYNCTTGEVGPRKQSTFAPFGFDWNESVPSVVSEHNGLGEHRRFFVQGSHECECRNPMDPAVSECHSCAAISIGKSEDGIWINVSGFCGKATECATRALLEQPQPELSDLGHDETLWRTVCIALDATNPGQLTERSVDWMQTDWQTFRKNELHPPGTGPRNSAL